MKVTCLNFILLQELSKLKNEKNTSQNRVEMDLIKPLTTFSNVRREIVSKTLTPGKKSPEKGAPKNVKIPRKDTLEKKSPESMISGERNPREETPVKGTSRRKSPDELPLEKVLLKKDSLREIDKQAERLSVYHESKTTVKDDFEELKFEPGEKVALHRTSSIPCYLNTSDYSKTDSLCLVSDLRWRGALRS